MSSDEVRIVVRGAKQAQANIRRMDVAISAASRLATDTVSRRVRTRVRGKLNGKPRWNHRGAGQGLESITLPGVPRHKARGGGPGKLTGELREGVGIRKAKLNAAGQWVGGVGVGGYKKHRRNFLKRGLEAKYPFFWPAVEAVAPQMAAIYAAAWHKAAVKRGLL